MSCLIRGSINIDEFFVLPHIVNPGETISSSSLMRRPGGKGANQACAVARSSGGKVTLVGAVGDDGIWVKERLKGYDVDVSEIAIVDNEVTGRAIIQLSTEDGENSIILHKGANHASMSLPSVLPERTAFLLLQNEIPLGDTSHYLSLAASAGASVVFNPSPMLTAAEIRAFEWGKLGWLVVNEGEMQALLNALPEAIDTAQPASEGAEATAAVPEKLRPLLPELYRLAGHPLLRSTSPPGLILTLGAAGSITLPPSLTPFHTPSAPLQGSYRDTTGAGDTFLGFFVGSLMRGLDVREAVLHATRAAGMAVEREGAMEAVPSWEEVEARLAADAK